MQVTIAISNNFLCAFKANTDAVNYFHLNQWHILLGLTLVAVAAAASTNEEVPRTRARQVTRQVTNPATKPAVRSSAQPAARQPTAAAARPATKLAARPATKPTVVQATKPAARSAALPTARSVASTTVRSAAKPTTRSVGSTSVRSVAKPAARPEWPSPRTIAQPVARSVSTPLAHPLIRLAPQRPKTVVREKKTIPGPQPYQISSYDGYENLVIVQMKSVCFIIHLLTTFFFILAANPVQIQLRYP